jgi:threonyl-tRNA synthetase
MQFMENEYLERGYQEVITPNIFKIDLFEKSKHAEHYKQNMFLFEIEKEEYGLKPMNCPGHCEEFRRRPRSYRELPLRMAEFGVLHRNEASGALDGLTRVRRFVQDDAHIFCRESQLKDELKGVLEFIKYTYDIFGLSFDVELSTRPEKYHGERATWDKAEAILTEALNEFGKPWQINEGDGAFYGPKIDFGVSNALKKKFQCATIQLDFQLPDSEQFELHYTAEGKEGKRERPVMIHRAVFGSFERFFALLLEHYKGKWPFWLSPRQAIVCPVSEKSDAYALQV